MIKKFTKTISREYEQKSQEQSTMGKLTSGVGSLFGGLWGAVRGVQIPQSLNEDLIQPLILQGDYPELGEQLQKQMSQMNQADLDKLAKNIRRLPIDQRQGLMGEMLSIYTHGGGELNIRGDATTSAWVRLVEEMNVRPSNPMYMAIMRGQKNEVSPEVASNLGQYARVLSKELSDSRRQIQNPQTNQTYIAWDNTKNKWIFFEYHITGMEGGTFQTFQGINISTTEPVHTPHLFLIPKNFEDRSIVKRRDDALIVLEGVNSNPSLMNMWKQKYRHRLQPLQPRHIIGIKEGMERIGQLPENVLQQGAEIMREPGPDQRKHLREWGQKYGIPIDRANVRVIGQYLSKFLEADRAQEELGKMKGKMDRYTKTLLQPKREQEKQRKLEKH